MKTFLVRKRVVTVKAPSSISGVTPAIEATFWKLQLPKGVKQRTAKILTELQ